MWGRCKKEHQDEDNDIDQEEPPQEAEVHENSAAEQTWTNTRQQGVGDVSAFLPFIVNGDLSVTLSSHNHSFGLVSHNVYELFMSYLSRLWRAVERRTVNRGDGGSIPPTAVSKLTQFRLPHTCLCLSEETLKAGGPFYMVSMPGGGKCVTCSGLSNSREESCVSPSLSCLEETT